MAHFIFINMTIKSVKESCEKARQAKIERFKKEYQNHPVALREFKEGSRVRYLKQIDCEGTVVGFTNDRIRVDFGEKNHNKEKVPGLYWPSSLQIVDARKSMKQIEVNEYGCCKADYCAFDRECACYYRAGEYRLEDGFTPEIFIDTETRKVFCKTAGEDILGSVHEMNLPVNYDKLGRGFQNINQAASLIEE